MLTDHRPGCAARKNSQKLRGSRQMPLLLFTALGLSLLVTALTASAAIAKGRALVFFNEYCITCKQDAHLIAAWTVTARMHYNITGVGFRELPAESVTFARSLGWTFPVIGDPDGRIASRWQVRTPTVIVLIGRHVRREDYSRWKGAASTSLRAGAAVSAGVSLDGSMIAVQSNGKTLIKLTCGGSAKCRGRLTLSTKRTSPARDKRHTKALTIATAAFAIPRGKTTTVKLQLSVAGRALLSAHHGGLGATLTILELSPGPPKRQTRRVHLLQRVAVGRRRTLTPRRPPITPHPVFVSSFAWHSQLWQDRYVLIRYLRLNGGSSTKDAEFAQGAEAGAPGIVGLPVVCGSPGEIEPLLANAGISAPVTVDTAPDCQATLNSELDGIAEAAPVGAERLFRFDGAPLASALTVGADFAAYDNAHTSAPLSIEPWMGDIPTPGNLYGIDSSDLAVPVPANLARTSDLAFSGSQGDVAVRSFWYVCPSCVSDQSDYAIQAWKTEHPQAQVVEITCDQTVSEAADWSYEHNWTTLPVYVYDGPLDFARCFSQVEEGQLHLSWYGDTAFLRNGQLNGAVACESFADMPFWAPLGCSSNPVPSS